MLFHSPWCYFRCMAADDTSVHLIFPALLNHNAHWKWSFKPSNFTSDWKKRKLFKEIKAYVHYFVSNLYFSPNDSPSKTMKNIFYFILKALFILEIFRFLYFGLPLFFSVSTIVLEVDPRKISKFMASSTL